MRKLLGAAALLIGFLAATAFTPYDKYQYFYTAVETVRLLDADDAYGSGVVIAPGRLATAAHLLSEGTESWVVVDGQTRRDFTIEYIDPTADVAVLAVPGLKCPCAPLVSALDMFDEIFVIGYPLGIFTPVLTTGRWQGPVRDYFDLITAPAAAGNSGGPVFTIANGRAELAGLLIGGKLQPVATRFGYLMEPVNYLSQMLPITVVKQAILCADGLDFNYCALGIPGDTLQ